MEGSIDEDAGQSRRSFARLELRGFGRRKVLQGERILCTPGLLEPTHDGVQRVCVLGVKVRLRFGEPTNRSVQDLAEGGV